jgi:ABC-type sugar transport system ATPase subunit
MDEPLSNLDAKLRVQMRAELKRLQKDLGITTIYVTHDQAEAMTMADKLVVMRGGQIQQIGEPETVYLYPSNVFVAGFIGSPPMNFVHCSRDGGWNRLKAPAFEWTVPAHYQAALSRRPSETVILGIRPEDLDVNLEPKPGQTLADVYVTEPMGKETLLTLQLGGTTVKAVAPPQIDLKIGDQVGITFAADRVRLFDAQTEEALPANGRPTEPAGATG